MAVNAGIFYSDGLFAIDLYLGEARERIGDAPPGVELARQSPLSFEWDGEKLERGEYDFVGLEVFSLEHLTEQDVRVLGQIPLPRVTCTDAGLVDVAVADVVRWAKATYHGVEGQMLGWPSSYVKTDQAWGT